MWIPRISSPLVLKALMETNKVIILTGPRQVGKTSLILKILSEINLKVKILSGEENHIKESFSSFNYEKMLEAVGNNEILFLDEAQEIAEIGKNIKILFDRNPTLKIILSGSSSFQLANNLQEPLTGRKKTFLLYPISVGELINCGYTWLEIKQNLNNYLRYGFYPDVIKHPYKEEKEATLIELVNAYLYKDVLQLSGIKKSQVIQNLLRLVALQTGNTVSVQKLSNALNMSSHTVNHYLDLLEQNYVVFRLSGFNRNLSKEISKQDKIYFYDVGVRNAILNNFNEPNFRSDNGAIWENFLIAERVKRNEYQGYKPNQYFWRTYTGAEIDYLEEKNGVLNAFEFKFNKKEAKVPATWKREYPDSTFQSINLDNFKDFV